MERYILIDLQEKEIICTSDLTKTDDGGSVKCVDNNDLIKELEDTLKTTIQMLKTNKYF